MSNIPGTNIPDIPVADWDDHLSDDITAFLEAVRGDDVRDEFVDMACVIANVILKQAVYTDGNLTDSASNAAAQAAAVGALFAKTPYFKGILGAGSTSTPPVTISVKSVTGNAIYALSGDTSRYIYTDLPEEATSAAGYLLSVEIDSQARMLVWFSRTYGICVNSVTGGSSWSGWKFGLDKTLSLENYAADAKAVGVALEEIEAINLLTPFNHGVLPDGTNLDSLVSSNLPLGLLGNSIVTLRGDFTYENAPAKPAYLLSIRLRLDNADGGYQVCFSRYGNIFTRIKTGGTWSDWNGGIDKTLSLPNFAADAASVGAFIQHMVGDYGEAAGDLDDYIELDDLYIISPEKTYTHAPQIADNWGVLFTHGTAVDYLNQYIILQNGNVFFRRMTEVNGSFVWGSWSGGLFDKTPYYKGILPTNTSVHSVTGNGFYALSGAYTYTDLPTWATGNKSGYLMTVEIDTQSRMLVWYSRIYGVVTEFYSNGTWGGWTFGERVEKTPYYNGILENNSSVLNISGNVIYSLLGTNTYAGLPDYITSPAGYIVSVEYDSASKMLVWYSKNYGILVNYCTSNTWSGWEKSYKEEPQWVIGRIVEIPGHTASESLRTSRIPVGNSTKVCLLSDNPNIIMVVGFYNEDNVRLGLSESVRNGGVIDIPDSIEVVDPDTQTSTTYPVVSIAATAHYVNWGAEGLIDEAEGLHVILENSTAAKAAFAEKRMAGAAIERPVLSIIDDDGLERFYLDVYPIIQSLKTPIASAVVAGRVGTTGGGGKRYMTWEQIETMRENGVEILNHTYSHYLTTDSTWASLTENDIAEDYRHAKYIFDKKGIPSKLLVFSHLTGYQDKAQNAAHDAGFSGGFLVGGNGQNQQGDDPFRIKRYAIGLDSAYPWSNVSALEELIDAVRQKPGWTVFMMHTSNDSWDSPVDVSWTDPVPSPTTVYPKDVLKHLCEYALWKGYPIVTAEGGFNTFMAKEGYA